jgi:integrase
MTQLAFDQKIIQFPTPLTPTPIIKPYSPSGQFTQYDSSAFCSDGRPKAQKAAPLRSFEDYTRIHAYFASNGRIRDAALLTIGIATGLRISDLVSLKYGHIYTCDSSGNLTFLRHITIYEQKTGKKTYSTEDSVLITEAVQRAANDLAAYTSKKEKRILSLDDWLFPSKQPRRSKMIEIEDDDGNTTTIEDPLYGEKVITPEYGHRIMKEAQKALNLPINIGSHTLRKTFLSAAYAIAYEMPAHNPSALDLTQTLARHDTASTTLRYINKTSALTTYLRNEISDLLLGKSTIINTL